MFQGGYSQRILRGFLSLNRVFQNHGVDGVIQRYYHPYHTYYYKLAKTHENHETYYKKQTLKEHPGTPHPPNKNPRKQQGKNPLPTVNSGLQSSAKTLEINNVFAFNISRTDVSYQVQICNLEIDDGRCPHCKCRSGFPTSGTGGREGFGLACWQQVKEHVVNIFAAGEEMLLKIFSNPFSI